MIKINPVTPKNPITLIGECIGVCYGSDITKPEKNYTRGYNAIMSGHGRALEYATVWFSFSEYSARMAREFYTHIGGAPTRTQSSTRYIDESGFQYFKPKFADEKAEALYESTMSQINLAYQILIDDFQVPKEDAANILPLGMYTTVSCHMNARTIMTMSEQRECKRAYSEFRLWMKEFKKELSDYSAEWKTLCDLIMKPKCEKLGFCSEEFSCGKFKKNIDK